MDEPSKEEAMGPSRPSRLRRPRLLFHSHRASALPRRGPVGGAAVPHRRGDVVVARRLRRRWLRNKIRCWQTAVIVERRSLWYDEDERKRCPAVCAMQLDQLMIQHLFTWESGSGRGEQAPSCGEAQKRSGGHPPAERRFIKVGSAAWRGLLWSGDSMFPMQTFFGSGDSRFFMP